MKLRSAERSRKPRRQPHKQKLTDSPRRPARRRKKPSKKNQLRPINRQTAKMLITKKSPLPKPQPGKSVKRGRREHPKKRRTVKTLAVAEVVVARRRAPSKSGRPSPRTERKPSPKRPRRLSKRPKIKKIHLQPTITKLRLSLSKYLTPNLQKKKRSPNQSLNLRLSHRCPTSTLSSCKA